MENGSFFLQLRGTMAEDVKTEAAASFAKPCPAIDCFLAAVGHGRQEPYPAEGRRPCVLGFEPGLCTVSCVKWLEPCLWAFLFRGVRGGACTTPGSPWGPYGARD